MLVTYISRGYHNYVILGAVVLVSVVLKHLSAFWGTLRHKWYFIPSGEIYCCVEGCLRESMHQKIRGGSVGSWLTQVCSS